MRNLRSSLEASAVFWSQLSAWRSEVSLCSSVCHFFLIFSFLVADVICFFPSIMLLALKKIITGNKRESCSTFPWIPFYLRRVKIPLALLEFSWLTLLRSPEARAQRNGLYFSTGSFNSAVWFRSQRHYLIWGPILLSLQFRGLRSSL